MICLRHVGVTVTEMDRSLKFYRDFLGLKILKSSIEHGDYIDNFSGIKNINVKVVKMITDGGVIELLQYYSHPSKKPSKRKITSVGCSHFAITVDNIDILYNDLLKKGVFFNSPPQYSPDGCAKVAFCHDPDGILIELVEVLKIN